MTSLQEVCNLANSFQGCFPFTKECFAIIYRKSRRLPQLDHAIIIYVCIYVFYAAGASSAGAGVSSAAASPSGAAAASPSGAASVKCMYVCVYVCIYRMRVYVERSIHQRCFWFSHVHV
jgi:hypothetical protein